jgi:hypothetical protein
MGMQHVDWLHLSSLGASWVILLMWDRRVVEEIDATVGHIYASCKFQNVLDQKEWDFFGVYAPNEDRDRLAMWDELPSVAT